MMSKHPPSCPICWGTGYERGWGRPCQNALVEVQGRDLSKLRFAVYTKTGLFLVGGPVDTVAFATSTGLAHSVAFYDGDQLVLVKEIGKDITFVYPKIITGNGVVVPKP